MKKFIPVAVVAGVMVVIGIIFFGQANSKPSKIITGEVQDVVEKCEQLDKNEIKSGRVQVEVSDRIKADDVHYILYDSDKTAATDANGKKIPSFDLSRFNDTDGYFTTFFFDDGLSKEEKEILRTEKYATVVGKLIQLDFTHGDSGTKYHNIYLTHCHVKREGE